MKSSYIKNYSLFLKETIFGTVNYGFCLSLICFGVMFLLDINGIQFEENVFEIISVISVSLFVLGSFSFIYSNFWLYDNIFKEELSSFFKISCDISVIMTVLMFLFAIAMFWLGMLD